MTDSGLKGRVKGLFAGAPPENEMNGGGGVHHASGLSESDAERQALQVLVLARRTADEHVSGALQESDKIRSDARAKADGIVKDAQATAEGIRQSADKILADARGKAENMARDAHASADGVRREADKTLVDARAKAEALAKAAQANAEGVRQAAEKVLVDGQAKAEDIVKGAQANADELERDAQQQYQDVVGSLETKRAAMQQKIEGLQQFDRDYRAQLRAFMQSQLRVLGPEEQQTAAPATFAVSAQIQE